MVLSESVTELLVGSVLRAPLLTIYVESKV